MPLSFSLVAACEENHSPIVLWNLNGCPKFVMFIGVNSCMG